MIIKKTNLLLLCYYICIAGMAGIYFSLSNIGVTSKDFWLILADYFPGISVNIPADFNWGILLPIVLSFYLMLLLYWVLIYLYCRD